MNIKTNMIPNSSNRFIPTFILRLSAFTHSDGKPDLQRTGSKFLRHFRQGRFGYILLEDLI